MMEPYYQDDYVTLYCGDCREIVPTLGRFDLLLTDPPYGIKRFNKKDGGNSKKIGSFGHQDTPWNNEPPSEDVLKILIGCFRMHVIFGMNNLPLPTTEHFIVWDKSQSMPSFAECELAWSSLSTPAKIARIRFVSGKQHPAEKPCEPMTWCISLAGEDAKTIFDPFCGSGTTGVAAKLMGRKCTLIEREERYCEIAAKRLCQDVLPMFEMGSAKKEENHEDLFKCD